jgi:hypothetical protein
MVKVNVKKRTEEYLVFVLSTKREKHTPHKGCVLVARAK